MCEYLVYKIRAEASHALFETRVGEFMTVMAQGKRFEWCDSYMEQYKAIWDIRAPKDERTAQEIIDDTFNRHGLKMKRGE